MGMIGYDRAKLGMTVLLAVSLAIGGVAGEPTKKRPPLHETAFNGRIDLPGGGVLEMVQIRAGSFMMGSPQKEIGTWGKSWGEQQRRVVLTNDFWLAKYETTQDQYQAVMHKNPSRFKGGRKPVDNVSWHEAVAFCETLNRLTAGKRPKGYVFALPTEAQWEYACRAGTASALNSGKNLKDGEVCPNLDQVGWYLANSQGSTHPVGQKRPNRWGLYDMHGNAWEWCSDWYGIHNKESKDPCGPKSGTGRVKKGGGFYLAAKRSRSGARSWNRPDEHKWYLTVRVALVPENKGNYEKAFHPEKTAPRPATQNSKKSRPKPGAAR